MKAIVWTAYGPPEVLQLREVAKPVPADNELLIRIRATTVTAGDCEARSLSFHPWLGLPIRLYVGLRRPARVTILGQELAGEVETTGKNVTRFRPGDPVIAATGFTFGAYAEYICLPETSDLSVVALKPGNLADEEAAAIPVGGLEALHFLRRAGIREGERLLINGAGGSIGTFAVQLAKLDGVEVTAVDSGEKLEMLRSIGADHVVDYTREDFTRMGRTYDVIYDVIGKSPFRRSLEVLTPGGRYMLANPRLADRFRAAVTGAKDGKRVITGAAGRAPSDLAYLVELIEAGKIRPVIDRRYPFAEMAEAHRYVETGRKRGAVVVVVAE